MVLIPAGAVIEVKLKDKRKVLGRMGEVSADSFRVQHAQGGKVIDEAIAFADVKSVRTRNPGMSSASKIALGVAAGAGATILILVGIALALS